MGREHTASHTSPELTSLDKRPNVEMWQWNCICFNVFLVQGRQDCKPTGVTVVPDLCVPRFLVAPVPLVSLVTSAAAHVCGVWFWNWLKFVGRPRKSDCVRVLGLKGRDWQHNENPCILCSFWYLCCCVFGVAHKARNTVRNYNLRLCVAEY